MYPLEVLFASTEEMAQGLDSVRPLSDINGYEWVFGDWVDIEVRILTSQ